MSRRILITLHLLIAPILVTAQVLQGELNYSHLGIKFTIPEGWQGQEIEDGLMLASEIHPGLILVTTNDAQSLEDIRKQGSQTIDFGEGAVFSPKGALRPVGSNGLVGDFEGTFQYQPARARMGGVYNPNGMGISVIVVTTAEAWSQVHETATLDIMKSVVFSKVEESSSIQEWRDYISNARLTYMDSYYSGGYGEGSVGGGYSSETIIELCARGYFNYSGSSEMTVGGSSSSGYSQSGSQGQGTWQVVQQADGTAALILTFYSGEQYSYTLSYEDNKTYLNGNRYFVTREGEYAPNCN